MNDWIIYTLHIKSPWYNCTGWLGVKHQFTYLLTAHKGFHAKQCLFTVPGGHRCSHMRWMKYKKHKYDSYHCQIFWSIISFQYGHWWTWFKYMYNTLLDTESRVELKSVSARWLILGAVCCRGIRWQDCVGWKLHQCSKTVTAWCCLVQC